MSKIAIDIVLLPPEEIADLAIRLSRELSGSKTNKIALGKNEGEAMPHMTLTMGCVEEKYITEIGQVLEKFILEFKNPTLELTDFYDGMLGNWTGVNTSNHDEVKKLHQSIIVEIDPLIDTEVMGDVFYPPGDLKREVPEWFFGFPKPENFFPHITLGYGDELKVNFGGVLPIKFKPAKIAICHLGDFYTCRKILWSREI